MRPAAFSSSWQTSKLKLKTKNVRLALMSDSFIYLFIHSFICSLSVHKNVDIRQAFDGEALSAKKPRLTLSLAVPASFEALAAGLVFTSEINN